MRILLNALLFPVLAGFCLLAAAAEKETYDIATFRAPPGWERLPLPGLLSFRTPPGEPGAAQIFLFPSQRSAASARANFEAEWARLVTAPLGPVPMPRLHTEQTLDGWTAVSGATNVTRQGASSAVMLLTATGFDRMISVVVHVTGQERIIEVDHFFRQLEFHAGTAQPPPAGAAPARPAEPDSAARSAKANDAPVPIAQAGADNNRPAGLFYRLEVQMQSGARLEAKTRLFLPGNRITRTFPFGGGDKFDTTRCLPDTCGSYKLDGATLSVRWDNGQVERLAFAATAEGISIDGTLFKPARGMTGAALAGEWNGAGDSGNAFSNVYKFARDGTFSFGTGQKNNATGRYRVQGLTLILTFADGTESRRTLFAAGKSEPIGLISVEGEIYKRK